MNIQELGWNDFFQASFEQYKEQGFIPGRVIRQDRESSEVFCESGTYSGTVSGKFRKNVTTTSDWPSIGDWVAISLNPGGTDATIHAVLSRKSAFTRRAAASGGMPESGGRTDEQILAANIDLLFLVTALDLDYNIRRIERYLSAAYDSGATPVIVLNKVDLCDETELGKRMVEVEAVAFGVDIIAVSATEKRGREMIEGYLTSGKTVALLGSSGVGKSTIINWMLDENRQATKEVREYDSRGRHTTTRRELIPLPNGGVLIDTPGIRLLKLWTDEASLEKAFEDIEQLATACRFSDCKHSGEPGCAVEAAIESGELDRKRFGNYLKLKSELRRLEIRKSGKERHIQKIEGKKFAKRVEEAIRLKQRRR